jgi:hypothetical protein
MPTIPFQTAQSMLPVRTHGGQVTAQETGMPQMGAGLEVLSNQLYVFQQQKEIAEANRQLSNAEADLDITWGSIEDEWKNNTHNWDESLPKKAQDDLERMKKVGDSITNEKARLQFQPMFARAQAAAQVELNSYQNKLQINQGVADLDRRTDSFQQLRAKTNNPIEKMGIDQLQLGQLQRDLESGFIDPTEYEKRKILWEQFTRSDDVVNEVFAMRNKYGDEKALAMLSDPNIHRELVNRSDERTVDGLHATLATSLTWKEHQEIEGRKQKSEAQESNYRSELVKFWSGEMNPNDTLGMIATGALDEEKGNQLLKDFRTRVDKEKTEKTDEKKKELEEISFLNYTQLLSEVKKVGATGNQQEINAMQERINEYFRKDEINDTHGKQLTDALYTAKDPKDPINNPLVKNKFQALDDLNNAGVFGEKGKPDSAIAFTKKQDEFTNWVRDHPEATSKEIEDRFANLIKDEKKGFWMKAVDLFMAARGLPTSEQGKAQSSPNVQKSNQPIDPEREKAIKFLKDNGKVVNEETIKMVIGKVK